MIVLADIGNSQIKVAISKNEDVTRIKTFSLNDLHLVKNYFSDICKTEKPNLLYSSVLGNNFEKKFRNITKKFFRKVTQFKSTKSFLSVKNAYNIPHKLGSDRWSQVIGAHMIYQSNTMIVSCGSAISIDYVTSKGSHKGGILLSGANRYTKCFSDIHNLKDIKLSKRTKSPSNIIENTTAKQISSGYELMISSCINKIYSDLNRESQKEVLLLLSGSYAADISNIIAKNKIIEPHFVLKSLCMIENYI